MIINHKALYLEDGGVASFEHAFFKKTLEICELFQGLGSENGALRNRRDRVLIEIWIDDHLIVIFNLWL